MASYAEEEDVCLRVTDARGEDVLSDDCLSWKHVRCYGNQNCCQGREFVLQDVANVETFDKSETDFSKSFVENRNNGSTDKVSSKDKVSLETSSELNLKSSESPPVIGQNTTKVKLPPIGVETGKKVKDVLQKGREFLKRKFYDYQQKIKTKWDSGSRTSVSSGDSDTANAEPSDAVVHKISNSEMSASNMADDSSTLADHPQCSESITMANGFEIGESESVKEDVCLQEETKTSLEDDTAGGDKGDADPDKVTNGDQTADDDIQLGGEALSMTRSTESFQNQSDVGGGHPFSSSSLVQQDSFHSDMTHNSQSTVSSVDALLENRKVDPEVLLKNLGFGGGEEDGDLCRIPLRFLEQTSSAKGISVNKFLKEHEELADLVQTLQQQKYGPQVDRWRFAETVGHAKTFVDTVQSSVAQRRLRSLSRGRTPYSILHPDNQLALAEQGYYDDWLKDGQLGQTDIVKDIPCEKPNESAVNKRLLFRKTRNNLSWNFVEEDDSEKSPYWYSNSYDEFGSGSALVMSFDSSDSNATPSWSATRGFNFSSPTYQNTDLPQSTHHNLQDLEKQDTLKEKHDNICNKTLSEKVDNAINTSFIENTPRNSTESTKQEVDDESWYTPPTSPEEPPSGAGHLFTAKTSETNSSSSEKSRSRKSAWSSSTLLEGSSTFSMGDDSVFEYDGSENEVEGDENVVAPPTNEKSQGDNSTEKECANKHIKPIISVARQRQNSESKKKSVSFKDNDDVEVCNYISEIRKKIEQRIYFSETVIILPLWNRTHLNRKSLETKIQNSSKENTKTRVPQKNGENIKQRMVKTQKHKIREVGEHHVSSKKREAISPDQGEVIQETDLIIGLCNESNINGKIKDSSKTTDHVNGPKLSVHEPGLEMLNSVDEIITSTEGDTSEVFSQRKQHCALCAASHSGDTNNNSTDVIGQAEFKSSQSESSIVERHHLIGSAVAKEVEFSQSQSLSQKCKDLEHPGDLGADFGESSSISNPSGPGVGPCYTAESPNMVCGHSIEDFSVTGGTASSPEAFLPEKRRLIFLSHLGQANDQCLAEDFLSQLTSDRGCINQSNCQSPLARTSSAQSDSSGFADAETDNMLDIDLKKMSSFMGSSGDSDMSINTVLPNSPGFVDSHSQHNGNCSTSTPSKSILYYSSQSEDKCIGTDIQGLDLIFQVLTPSGEIYQPDQGEDTHDSNLLSELTKSDSLCDNDTQIGSAGLEEKSCRFHESSYCIIPTLYGSDIASESWTLYNNSHQDLNGNPTPQKSMVSRFYMDMSPSKLQTSQLTLDVREGKVTSRLQDQLRSFHDDLFDSRQEVEMVQDDISADETETVKDALSGKSVDLRTELEQAEENDDYSLCNFSPSVVEDLPFGMSTPKMQNSFKPTFSPVTGNQRSVLNLSPASKSDGHMTFSSCQAASTPDMKSKSSEELESAIFEYQKLASLVNQASVKKRRGLGSVTTPRYTGPNHSDRWRALQDEQRLAEENRLMQQAIDRYKVELRHLENCFNAHYGKVYEMMTEEERDEIEELQLLRSEVYKEVCETEKLVRSRGVQQSRANSAVKRPMASLDVVHQMIELLKEQMYQRTVVMDLDSSVDAVLDSSSSSVLMSPWEEEVSDLRDELRREQRSQQRRLERSFEGLKESLLDEVKKEIHTGTEFLHRELQNKDKKITALQSEIRHLRRRSLEFDVRPPR